MSEKIDFLIQEAFIAGETEKIVETAAENLDQLSKNSLNESIRSAYKLERFDLALEFAEKASKKFPEESIFSLFVARSHSKLGNIVESLDVYSEIRQNHPSISESHLMIARAKYAESDYRATIEVVDSCREIFPENESMITLKARSLQNLEMYDLAYSSWKQLVEINPENVEAHSRIGQIAYNERRYEEATDSLESALAINPEYRIARRLIGLCYDATGQTQIASKWLLKEAISEPLIYSNWLKAIDVILKEGNEKEARKLIEKIPQHVVKEPQSTWFSFLLSKSISWTEHQEILWEKIESNSLEEQKSFDYFTRELLDIGEIGLSVDLLKSVESSGNLDCNKSKFEIEKIINELGFNFEDIKSKKNLLASELAIAALSKKGQLIRLKRPQKWPISILHISSSMGQGGAERQLLALAKSQVEDQRFSKVMLLTYANQEIHNTYISEAESAGIKVFTYSDPRNFANEFPKSKMRAPEILTSYLPKRLLRDLGPLTRAIDTLNPGMVHIWQDNTNIIGGLAVQWAGAPAAIMSCRSMRPDAKTMLHIRNRQYLLRGYLALLSDSRFSLVVNSQAGANSYMDWTGLEDDRIRVIRNGYDFEKFTSKDRNSVDKYLKENGITEGCKIIGSVFRFVPEKRVDLWIQVAKEVISKSDDTYFVAVGHGSGLDEAKNLVKNLNLESRILFPGRTKDVPSWLEKFDVFLLTSKVEGLPNVLIEAQSIGIPVMSTLAGGSEETFIDGKTGYLTLSDSPKDIAESLDIILHDREWLNMAKNKSKEYVRSEFDVNSMAESYIGEYSKLLESSRQRWMESRTLMDRLLFRR